MEKPWRFRLKSPGIQEREENEKVTGYSATGIGRLCPAAAHRADENHRHGQPGFGLLSAIRRYPGPVQTPQGVSTSANYPAAKPSMSGRCGAGIIRLNRNRQGRQPGGQHPGMILLGVLRGVQQRQRLALRQRRQPQARFAMGVELLAIALAEVGEIDRLAVKGFTQLSGRR
jgi:hypothetical protein